MEPLRDESMFAQFVTYFRDLELIDFFFIWKKCLNDLPIKIKTQLNSAVSSTTLFSEFS